MCLPYFRTTTWEIINHGFELKNEASDIHTNVIIIKKIKILVTFNQPANEKKRKRKNDRGIRL